MYNRFGLMLVFCAVMSTVAMAQSPVEPTPYHPRPQAMQLSLEKLFHTRSPWSLVVTEGLLAKDYGGNEAPGALTLCLHKGLSDPCIADPVTPALRPPSPDYAVAWAPHYLIAAKPVYPDGPKGKPLLLIVTGSLNSGDGDQLIYTQLIAYDADRNAFRRVYGDSMGHNNNQEIRFMTDGPLRGSVISAKPQEHLPYGYWIVVQKLTPMGAYRQILRYRSATLYNDGNPLAVIDSEMPNIENRLGLWRPGDPIPTPRRRDGKPCLKPVLRHAELWCG